MSFLVAAIEHHARRTVAAVTRAVTVRLSGYSNYEAGDFLARNLVRDGRLAPDAAAALAEREAEEEVAEPRTPSAPTSLRDFIVGDQYCALCYTNITGIEFHHCPLQSPAASAGGGESSSSEVCDPPAPSEERATVPEAVSADPSPAPASGLTWVDWATPAIVDVLREHRYLLTVGQCSCPCDSPRFISHSTWTEHVAPLIAERLVGDMANFAAAAACQAVEVLEAVLFPQHRNT